MISLAYNYTIAEGEIKMKSCKYISVIFAVILALCLTVSAESIRHPVIAGKFYPADKSSLANMLDSLLEQAEEVEISGPPLALVSPHAGFIFSGPTAAVGYRLLRDYSQIKTAVIIGFKHQIDYKGIAIWDKGGWQTPLGISEIDTDLASAIRKGSKYIASGESYFNGEHSLETQLPFLQYINPEIKIVPLQIGLQEKKMIAELVRVVPEAIGEREDVIIIASTDLTHYKSRSECREIDKRTAGYIRELKGRELWQAEENGVIEMCGAGPTAAAIEIAKKLGANSAKILRRSDSGEFSGNTSNVVSYLSAVIYHEEHESPDEATDEAYLSPDERQVLLNIARESIEAWLAGRPVPEFDPPQGVLTDDGAAFVTINKNHRLRGCIGYTEAFMPLYQAVSSCAVKAASEDPRFPRLAGDEYPEIELEISVLTPLQKINDIDQIEVGKHGLMIQKGPYRGLLLPQVATSYGWSRIEFLDHTCQKAGLNPGCWKDDCKIMVFSAEVFGEE